MMTIVSHSERMKFYYCFLWATIFFNLLQLLVGFKRDAWDAYSIRKAAEKPEFFSGLFFENRCLFHQKNLIQPYLSDGDPVSVGIVPMFIAETVVLALVMIFVATVLNFTRRVTVDRRSKIIGICAGTLLFLVDQARYSWTSIFDPDKAFFTWSSYCVHGDLGWLLDVLGYVTEYALIAICIASFCAALNGISLGRLDLRAENLGQKDMFLAVEGTFTWLVYFGYAFLVIWVVFSGITPQASRIYALQGLLIYIVIFGFYFIVIFQYWRISRWYDAVSNQTEGTVAVNPVVDFVAPHGTKPVQTFIKLALPIIFFLSIWYEWIKPLTLLGGG